MNFMTGEQLRDTLAEAMAPDEWAEFNDGIGTCSNQAGWKVLETIRHANAAVIKLFELGAFGIDPGENHRSTACIPVD